MKYFMLQIFVIMVIAQNVYALDPVNGVANSVNPNRVDYGWGGDSGGNLEMYSKFDTTGRKGELRFVYGGGEFGNIRYMHYNGTSWLTKLYLDKNGAVGINTGEGMPCSDCKLAVKGKIQAEEIVVSTTWADYVFKDNYKLMALKDVETYIDDNGHLPGVPSASEVAKEGVNIGDMTKTLLEKVEELTLHMIELKKENEILKEKMAAVTIQK